jgi:hypothetical protein
VDEEPEQFKRKIVDVITAENMYRNLIFTPVNILSVRCNNKANHSFKRWMNELISKDI